MNSSEVKGITKNPNFIHRVFQNINLKFHAIKVYLQPKHKINEKQLSMIAGSLAQIYKDGIRITEALDLVADILPNKAYKNSVYKVLISIREGRSLSQSFAQFKDLYPEFFVGIIAIGENTGKLYEVLKGLNVYYDKSLFIKQEIKNACAYPLFMFISMIVLSAFFVNEIIPSFCEIYKSMNIELPISCKFIYDLNITLKNKPLVVGITIISWTLIFFIVLKYFLEKFDISKLTRINIVKSFFEYIMILLFSIITSSGINISHALEYCENSITFVYLRKKIREINLNIINGKTLTESLGKSGIFSRYTLAIIKIREETGTIEDGFKELSKSLEYKLSERIKRYLKLINPIFMLIMASFIMLFLLEFVLPLFDKLQSGIRQ
jgi:type IV pilus assembly protein PilC